MDVHVMAEITEMNGTCLLDIYLADGDAQVLHQFHGIGISAVRGAESRHGNAHDAPHVTSQLAERTFAYEEC